MHILAGIIFALASITDYLDGYLARRVNVIHFWKFTILWPINSLVMSALSCH